MSLECALKRMGPDVVQPGDGTFDHRAPLIFYAESIAADDLANLVRRHSTLSRNLKNAGKRSWCDGYDGARAMFAEEGILGRARFLRQIDPGAELQGSVLRTCREAGFSQCNSDASVAHVVRRTHRA